MTALVFLQSADAGIQEAYNYHEDQWGGGDVLLESLNRSFALLSEFPEIAPIFFGKYRRMLVRSFPYGIFYVLESKRIVVVALMNLRRDPQAILRRLGP